MLQNYRWDLGKDNTIGMQTDPAVNLHLKTIPALCTRGLLTRKQRLSGFIDPILTVSLSVNRTIFSGCECFGGIKPISRFKLRKAAPGARDPSSTISAIPRLPLHETRLSHRRMLLTLQNCCCCRLPVNGWSSGTHVYLH